MAHHEMGLINTFKKLFSKDPDPVSFDIEAVERIVGYKFINSKHLLLALTHRSFSGNDADNNDSNERMEFLGDSVLGLVIAHRLFLDHPDWREGDLTKTKALLVNETTLFEVGKEIGLNNHILLSTDEARAGGAERPSIVSDAMESVIAAIYLDGGLEAARKFILKEIYSRKSNVQADSSQRNYKGELLEFVQARGEGMPRYDVVSEQGPDHEKTFSVVVNINGKSIGSGVGSSKKEAEQKAAAEALELMLKDVPQEN